MTTFENFGYGKLKANQVAVQKQDLMPNIYNFKNGQAAKDFVNDFDVVFKCQITKLTDDALYMLDSDYKSVTVYWKN